MKLIICSDVYLFKGVVFSSLWYFIAMVFYNFIIIYFCHLPGRKCSDSSADISSDETESDDEDNNKKLKEGNCFINHVLSIPVFMFNK